MTNFLNNYHTINCVGLFKLYNKL